jgi:hypothetical protein
MLSVVCSRSAQRIASLRQIDSCLSALSNIRFFAIDRRRKGHDSPGRSRKNSIKERDRGNSRLGPSSTGEEESNITGMKEMIDRIDQGMEIPLKVSLWNLDVCFTACTSYENIFSSRTQNTEHMEIPITFHIKSSSKSANILAGQFERQASESSN